MPSLRSFFGKGSKSQPGQTIDTKTTSDTSSLSSEKRPMRLRGGGCCGSTSAFDDEPRREPRRGHRKNYGVIAAVAGAV